MRFSIFNFRLLSLSLFLFLSIFFLPKNSFGNSPQENINSEFQNSPIEKILSFSNDNNGFKITLLTSEFDDTIHAQISFPFIDVVKVNMNSFEDKFLNTNSVSYKMIDNDNSIIISTDSVSVHIQKNPWKLTLVRGDENIFMQGTEFQNSNDVQNFRVVAEMTPDEHFYGFGEKFNGLDQRGKKVVMELDDAYMSTDNQTYKSIPFFLSSRGYGFLVNSPKRVIFHMGDLSDSSYSFENPDSLIEYYIFTNKDPLKQISQYTTITGRSPIVPKWSLEPWLSRRRVTGWTKPAIAEADIDLMIKDGFRIGVILWEGITQMYTGSHGSDMNRLSDKWHEMGIKQVCWGYTGHTANKGKRDWNDALNWSSGKKEYFIRDLDGSIKIGNKRDRRNRVFIDPTNPDAMTWWKEQLYRHKFSSENGKSTQEAWNLDGIKIDFSELFAKDDDNLLGIDKSIGMHNQHAVFYSKQMYDWLQELRPEGGITWVRGGGIGLQTVGFVWGGDRGRTFEQMRGTVAASLGVSICGVSLIGHDLGGYRGGDTPEERKVYIRGVQYATFSPSFHDHGSAPAPWEQDEYGKENYRFYSRVRYNIIPYLYHYVKVSHDTGIPIMRTLYMYHPNDEKTFTIEDEYYLGDDILVAPIISESNEREIYLPEGKWIDFWNQDQFNGRQKINYKAPLNRIPLFVKAGSILPLELNSSLQIGGLFPEDKKNNLLLTFRVFEGEDSELEFFADSSTIQINKSIINNGLEINIENIDQDFALIIDGLLPGIVTANGEQIKNVHDRDFDEINEGWYFDKNNGQTLIKIKSKSNLNNYRIELNTISKDFAKNRIENNLNPPEIIQAIGWDNSINIFFNHVENVESYRASYWTENSDVKTEIYEVTNTPVKIPNLENGKEYNITISSVESSKIGKPSSVQSVIPIKRSAFFKPENGEVFINGDHFLLSGESNDTALQNFTYGLFVPDSSKYSVWLKIKKGEGHYLYYRWYKLDEIILNKGENFITFEFEKEFSSSMLFFSSNENNRPVFKNEIESAFVENQVKVVNEKRLLVNEKMLRYR